MNKINLKCQNCGKTARANILPIKHAVKNTARKLNNKSKCCEKPDYKDENGSVKKFEPKSIQNFIPMI